MGDHYTSVHLPELNLSEVDLAHAAVMTSLIVTQIISAHQDQDAVLAPMRYQAVHRPGDAVRDLHANQKHFTPVQALLTNGMAACVGKSYNVMSIIDVESLTCPACQVVQTEAIIKTLGDAITFFEAQGQMPQLCCMACNQTTDIRQWPEVTPMGFSYLGYEFWNWPPLQLDGWHVDIPGLIADAAKSRVSIGAGYI